MDLFDLIGPVMIGPSSSHTAGAARIGLYAHLILDDEVADADIGFHGSFAKTYHGHGTDRAVIGGLMGMEVDDPHLRNSLEIAQNAGLKYTFSEIKLRGAHPNTVVLSLVGKHGKKLTMEAASVGGGNIEIKKLNGMNVSFSGRNNTLIVTHMDIPGTIAVITDILAKSGANIANMQDYRQQIKGKAVMILELDSELPQKAIDEIAELKQVTGVSNIKRSVG